MRTSRSRGTGSSGTRTSFHGVDGLSVLAYESVLHCGRLPASSISAARRTDGDSSRPEQETTVIGDPALSIPTTAEATRIIEWPKRSLEREKGGSTPTSDFNEAPTSSSTALQDRQRPGLSDVCGGTGSEKSPTNRKPIPVASSRIGARIRSSVTLSTWLGTMVSAIRFPNPIWEASDSVIGQQLPGSDSSGRRYELCCR